VSGPSPAERLAALADHLDPALAYHLRRLVAADSQAHRYLEVCGRARRAEDLAAERLRRLHGMEGAFERARDRADQAEARARAGMGRER
jgi:tRNA isopentenyl-2-thiomethyl-A-37 hydroxylase MiaE